MNPTRREFLASSAALALSPVLPAMAGEGDELLVTGIDYGSGDCSCSWPVRSWPVRKGNIVIVTSGLHEGTYIISDTCVASAKAAELGLSA